MKETRRNELMESLTAFNKEGYQKSELQGEFLKLQKECVRATYDFNHAELAGLRIHDVVKHLEQVNENNRHIADEELDRFRKDSIVLDNLIKAEISGNKGELKACQTLEKLQSNNVILKNIELSDGDNRTELDIVVITPKCATIVEVKNSSKDIFIDDEGNYFRNGEYQKWDCNIGEKMNFREKLLKNILAEKGYRYLPVRSIVVFTNNRIEVQNKYRLLKTCFLSQLPYLIDESKFDEVIGRRDMEIIQEAIQGAANSFTYSIDFDAQQFKEDFVNLMVKLEFANEEEAEKEELKTKLKLLKKKVSNESKKKSFKDVVKATFDIRNLVSIGSKAAAGLIIFNTVRKGGF